MKFKSALLIPSALLCIGLLSQSQKVLADTAVATKDVMTEVPNDSKPIPTMTPQEFTGRINYVAGYSVKLSHIYGSEMIIDDNQVQHGFSYKVYGYTDVNNVRYYNIGYNQWIPGKYLINRDNGQPVIISPDGTLGEAPKDSTATPVPDSFIGQVSVKSGSVNLWAIDGNSYSFTGKRVAAGTKYKVFSRTQVKGVTFYNLGGNQWIDANFIQKVTANNKPANKGQAVSNEEIAIKNGTTLSVVGYSTKAGIAVYQKTNSGMHVIKNKYLANGTSWKVFDRTEANGLVYYNVGGNQWVASMYVVLSNPTNASIEMNIDWVSQYSPIKAPWGCASAALAMLLSYDGFKVTKDSLKYMQDHLPMYNTTPGGQKGNVYTGAGFGYVINANALTGYAHNWSSKVRNVSGINAEGIKKLVLGGHPVLYFGWSSYQNLNADTNRNHCKVIIGYKDGKFLVLDPLYWPGHTGAAQGGTHETGVNNGYDLGAKHWTTISHFNREFAGNALTI